MGTAVDKVSAVSIEVRNHRCAATWTCLSDFVLGHPFPGQLGLIVSAPLATLGCY